MWQFMAVGHTKFRPDEGFGQIRRHIDGHSNILSILELKEAIIDSFVSDCCVMYPADELQDWNEVSKVFKPLEVIRKHFAYKIHIKAVYEDGNRKAVVDIYYEPNSVEPNRSVCLHRRALPLPTFDSFSFIPV